MEVERGGYLVMTKLLILSTEDECLLWRVRRYGIIFLLQCGIMTPEMVIWYLLR